MTARVHLHIGLPKTGTTYLQGGLWAQRAQLADRGMLLPGGGHRRHLLASLDVREDPKLARRAGDVRHPWQDLVDEVVGWSGPDALITHEFFAAASPAQVQRVVDSFPGMEVHVVVTARDMVTLGLSRWQEWVKNGGTAPVDRYPRKREYDPTDEWGWGSFDLADVLRRWGSVVPHERIHVIPVVPDPERPHALWSSFLEVVGMPEEGLPAPERPRNESLGLVEVELLRRVNARLEGFSSAADRGTWIRGYLGNGVVIRRTGERFRADDATLAELERRAHDAVAELGRGGYDVRGDVSALAPRRPDGDLRHPAEVTEAELLDAATRTIATMLADVRSLTEQPKRPRRVSEQPRSRLLRRVSVLRFSSRRGGAQQ